VNVSSSQQNPLSHEGHEPYFMHQFLQPNTSSNQVQMIANATANPGSAQMEHTDQSIKEVHLAFQSKKLAQVTPIHFT
jgi:hypothetical protein